MEKRAFPFRSDFFFFFCHAMACILAAAFPLSFSLFGVAGTAGTSANAFAAKFCEIVRTLAIAFCLDDLVEPVSK